MELCFNVLEFVSETKVLEFDNSIIDKEVGNAGQSKKWKPFLGTSQLP